MAFGTDRVALVTGASSGIGEAAARALVGAGFTVYGTSRKAALGETRGRVMFLPLDGMGQLILFRGLQGVGAGMVMGLLFTIVGDIFSPAERGRYQGLFAAVWGVASIFGPTLGGWLTDNWSWRACFWVNLPVGAIAVAAIYFEFPHMKPRGATRTVLSLLRTT